MLYIGSNQCINGGTQSNVYSFGSRTLYMKEYLSDWDNEKVLYGSKSIVGINFNIVDTNKHIGNIYVQPDGFISTLDFERKEFILSCFSNPNMSIGIDVEFCCNDIIGNISRSLGHAFVPGYKYITDSLDKYFRLTFERFRKNGLDEFVNVDDGFVLEVVNRKLLTRFDNLFGSCDFTVTDLEGLGFMKAEITQTQLSVCKNRVCGKYPITEPNTDSKPSNIKPVTPASKKPVVIVRKRKVESPKVERNLISANRGTSSYYFDVSKKVLNRQDMLIAGLGYMKETRPNFFKEVVEFWNDIDPDFFFDIETKTVEWEDSQNDISMETVSGETEIEVRQKIHALTEE